MSIIDSLWSNRFSGFTCDKNILTLRSGGCMNKTTMFIKRDHIDSIVVVKKMNILELLIGIALVIVGIYLNQTPTEYILVGVGALLAIHAVISYFIRPLILRTNNGVFITIGCSTDHESLINWFCSEEAELFRGSSAMGNGSINNNSNNNQAFNAPLLNNSYDNNYNTNNNNNNNHSIV